MDNKDKVRMGQSKGILEGLNIRSKEHKNEGILEVKNKGILDCTKSNVKIKRSYLLSEDTIKKLGRMKLDDFPTGTSLESIVEKAIIDYYEHNHKS